MLRGIERRHIGIQAPLGLSGPVIVQNRTELTPATRQREPMSRNPSASTTTITTVEAQLAAAAQMVASGAVTRNGRSAATLNLGRSVSGFDMPPPGAVATMMETHNKQANALLGQLLTSSTASEKMSFKDALEEYVVMKRRLEEAGEDTDIGKRLKRRCLYLEKVMDDTENSGHTFNSNSNESSTEHLSMAQQPEAHANDL